MYYLVDWERTPEGRRPALPDEVDFLLLAEPSSVADFGLFEMDSPQELAPSPQIEAVAEHIADLLDSCKHYPPALALARGEIERMAFQSRKEFMESLAARLRFYLNGQPIAPFFLARAKKGEAGYRCAGAYYWIVGFREDESRVDVAWVSGDNFVYHDSIADFDVDATTVARRFGVDARSDVSIPVLPTGPLAKAVVVTDEELTVELADGRRIMVPLAWYPRLLNATPAERQNCRLLGDGYAIEWPDLDEHIGIEGLLAGRLSGESRQSLERWLAKRRDRRL